MKANGNSLSNPTLTASVLAALFTFSLVSCGSGSNSSQASAFQGNTNVTLVLSSTANDQLQEFGLVFQGITLTSQSGKTVTLFKGNKGSELMVVNGGASPFTTASIPQGIYTTANVTLGSAEFTCVQLTPLSSQGAGGIAMSTFAYGQVPASNVTINLPSPITVTGNSMALQLDLLVAQSATYSACYSPGTASPYSITPTFTLNPMPIAAQPTNPNNGKVENLVGQITGLASSGNTFTLTAEETGFTCPCPGSNRVQIATNSSTIFQGISGFSALAPNTLVDLDGGMQADGSLLASRVAAYDPAAVNVMTGPLLFIDSTYSAFYALGRQQQGPDYSLPFLSSIGFYDFSGSTIFQISGQFNNLSSLPFVPSFSAINMVAGQNVSVFSQRTTQPHTAATTITLMPQIINGTVVAAAQSGSFTDYSVSLASYDLFPNLAVQPGQTSILNNPSIVEVYVDNSTQHLNTQALALGNTLRFYGLVFNDNGTLRMDCAQINDGVTASSQSNSAAGMAKGQTKILFQKAAESIRQVVTITSPSAKQ